MRKILDTTFGRLLQIPADILEFPDGIIQGFFRKSDLPSDSRGIYLPACTLERMVKALQEILYLVVNESVEFELDTGHGHGDQGNTPFAFGRQPYR